MCACMLTSFGCVQLFETLMSTLFMRFSREEYWSGLSCPPPGGLPKQGIEPTSLGCSCTGRQADSLPLAPPGKPVWNIYIPLYISTFIGLLLSDVLTSALSLTSIVFLRFCFVFGCAQKVCGILVHRPGIKPTSPAVGAWNLGD